MQENIEGYVFLSMKKGRRQIDICVTPYSSYTIVCTQPSGASTVPIWIPVSVS